MNMNELLQNLLLADANATSVFELAVSMLLPFFLSFPIVYSYRTVSHVNNFSRSFMLSIFLFAVLSSVVTVLIGNNIARAFGLLGALSIVRFRSALKDPLDAVYIFWSLTLGMASGTGAYLIALMVVFGGVLMMAFLQLLGIGSPKYLDSILRVVTKDEVQSENTIVKPMAQVEAILKKNFNSCKKINEYFDSSTNKKTYVYTLKRKPKHPLANIEKNILEINGVADVRHLNQDSSLFTESK